jgi:pimeloyl-ACP methyl ester carboxylesterase
MQDSRYHRDLEAEVPGGSIAGWQVGAGPAVLLLHGGPGLSDYTFPLAAELDDAFGVIGYQQRGLPPTVTSGPFDIEQHVADAIAVLDAAGGETEALRRRAELEHRSMQEVARQAIREYVENHSRAELLDRVLDEELPRYAEALERLGQ